MAAAVDLRKQCKQQSICRLGLGLYDALIANAAGRCICGLMDHDPDNPIKCGLMQASLGAD